MNVLISGASGLIGQALTSYLSQQGHTVYPLQRTLQQGPFYWHPDEDFIHLDNSIPIDAVVNLNGVNIAEHRWNKTRKEAIFNSRIQSTRVLVEALCNMNPKPKVFISASAIGFYGDTEKNIVNEEAEGGNNFLADIAKAWEAETQAAQACGIRTVNIRTSMVLSQLGGALKEMLLPFKFGLGGVLGSGDQLTSWISLEDECRAIEFLLNHESFQGPTNLCAPNVISNREFTRALGAALKRPTVLPMPSFMVKLLFGEMGELLLLGSVGVYPKRLLEAGFEFSHADIESALSSILSANQ